VPAALALVLPLALGGALSPVMLTEQTVLLAGPGGAAAAVRYAAGVIVTLLAIVLALLLFGRAISLPTAPHLDASLDVVLGVGLLLAAALVHRLGNRPPRTHHRSDLREAAFPFGVVSMATNVTTIALVTPAAKAISVADTDVVGRAILVVVLVGIASVPAWGPVALTRLAPGPGERLLAALGAFVQRRGRDVAVALLAVAGLLLLGRGVIRLAG